MASLDHLKRQALERDVVVRISARNLLLSRLEAACGQWAPLQELLQSSRRMPSRQKELKGSVARARAEAEALLDQLRWVTCEVVEALAALRDAHLGAEFVWQGLPYILLLTVDAADMLAAYGVPVPTWTGVLPVGNPLLLPATQITSAETIQPLALDVVRRILSSVPASKGTQPVSTSTLNKTGKSRLIAAGKTATGIGGIPASGGNLSNTAAAQWRPAASLSAKPTASLFPSHTELVTMSTEDIVRLRNAHEQVVKAVARALLLRKDLAATRPTLSLKPESVPDSPPTLSSSTSTEAAIVTDRSSALVTSASNASTIRAAAAARDTSTGSPVNPRQPQPTEYESPIAACAPADTDEWQAQEAFVEGSPEEVAVTRLHELRQKLRTPPSTAGVAARRAHYLRMLGDAAQDAPPAADSLAAPRSLLNEVDAEIEDVEHELERGSVELLDSSVHAHTQRHARQVSYAGPHEAATAIQRRGRGMIYRAQGRAYMAKAKQAVLRIQCFARMISAQRRVAHMRRRRDAAIRIQAIYRGYAVRKSIERKRYAAMADAASMRAARAIQALLRGVTARKRVLGIKRVRALVNRCVRLAGAITPSFFSSLGDAIAGARMPPEMASLAPESDPWANRLTPAMRPVLLIAQSIITLLAPAAWRVQHVQVIGTLAPAPMTAAVKAAIRAADFSLQDADCHRQHALPGLDLLSHCNPLLTSAVASAQAGAAASFLPAQTIARILRHDGGAWCHQRLLQLTNQAMGKAGGVILAPTATAAASACVLDESVQGLASTLAAANNQQQMQHNEDPASFEARVEELAAVLPAACRGQVLVLMTWAMSTCRIAELTPVCLPDSFIKDIRGAMKHISEGDEARTGDIDDTLQSGYRSLRMRSWYLRPRPVLLVISLDTPSPVAAHLVKRLIADFGSTFVLIDPVSQDAGAQSLGATATSPAAAAAGPAVSVTRRTRQRVHSVLQAGHSAVIRVAKGAGAAGRARFIRDMHLLRYSLEPHSGPVVVLVSGLGLTPDPGQGKDANSMPSSAAAGADSAGVPSAFAQDAFANEADALVAVRKLHLQSAAAWQTAGQDIVSAALTRIAEATGAMHPRIRPAIEESWLSYAGKAAKDDILSSFFGTPLIEVQEVDTGMSRTGASTAAGAATAIYGGALSIQDVQAHAAYGSVVDALSIGCNIRAAMVAAALAAAGTKRVGAGQLHPIDAAMRTCTGLTLLQATARQAGVIPGFLYQPGLELAALAIEENPSREAVDVSIMMAALLSAAGSVAQGGRRQSSVFASPPSAALKLAPATASGSAAASGGSHESTAAAQRTVGAQPLMSRAAAWDVARRLLMLPLPRLAARMTAAISKLTSLPGLSLERVSQWLRATGMAWSPAMAGTCPVLPTVVVPSASHEEVPVISRLVAESPAITLIAHWCTCALTHLACIVVEGGPAAPLTKGADEPVPAGGETGVAASPFAAIVHVAATRADDATSGGGPDAEQAEDASGGSAPTLDTMASRRKSTTTGSAAATNFYDSQRRPAADSASALLKTSSSYPAPLSGVAAVSSDGRAAMTALANAAAAPGFGALAEGDSEPADSNPRLSTAKTTVLQAAVSAPGMPTTIASYSQGVEESYAHLLAACLRDQKVAVLSAQLPVQLATPTEDRGADDAVDVATGSLGALQVRIYVYRDSGRVFFLAYEPASGAARWTSLLDSPPLLADILRAQQALAGISATAPVLVVGGRDAAAAPWKRLAGALRLVLLPSTGSASLGWQTLGSPLRLSFSRLLIQPALHRVLQVVRHVPVMAMPGAAASLSGSLATIRVVAFAESGSGIGTGAQEAGAIVFRAVILDADMKAVGDELDVRLSAEEVNDAAKLVSAFSQEPPLMLHPSRGYIDVVLCLLDRLVLVDTDVHAATVTELAPPQGTTTSPESFAGGRPLVRGALTVSGPFVVPFTPQHAATAPLCPVPQHVKRVLRVCTGGVGGQFVGAALITVPRIPPSTEDVAASPDMSPEREPLRARVSIFEPCWPRTPVLPLIQALPVELDSTPAEVWLRNYRRPLTVVVEHLSCAEPTAANPELAAVPTEVVLEFDPLERLCLLGAAHSGLPEQRVGAETSAAAATAFREQLAAAVASRVMATEIPPQHMTSEGALQILTSAQRDVVAVVHPDLVLLRQSSRGEGSKALVASVALADRPTRYGPSLAAVGDMDIPDPVASGDLRVSVYDAGGRSKLDRLYIAEQVTGVLRAASSTSQQQGLVSWPADIAAFPAVEAAVEPDAVSGLAPLPGALVQAAKWLLADALAPFTRGAGAQ